MYLAFDEWRHIMSFLSLDVINLKKINDFRKHFFNPFVVK